MEDISRATHKCMVILLVAMLTSTIWSEKTSYTNGFYVKKILHCKCKKQKLNNKNEIDLTKDIVNF